MLVFLCRFDCVAHINVIPRADVGKIQEEVSKVLAKDREIDHYRISTDPGFIFVYPLGKFQFGVYLLRPDFIKWFITNVELYIQDPTQCKFCNIPLSVKFIFLVCPSDNVRRRLFL